MSEKSLFGEKVSELYRIVCRDNWNVYLTSIIIALLTITLAVWATSWGAEGGVRNWGQWVLYAINLTDRAPQGPLYSWPSIIIIGFMLGAFISAFLGGDFAFRVPPKLEMVKACVAGSLMGIGAALAGGCNVGGFYNALANFSAHGFTMMIGLIIGAALAVKYMYWEMDNISWGQGGGKTLEVSSKTQNILGVLLLLGIIIWAYAYSARADEHLQKAGGILILAAALGYAFQRGRWCMIQAFREPHMTGDCKMAKAVILSIVLLIIGMAVVKSTGILPEAHYVRGVFGLGGIIGGIIFGFGAVMAGGCGTGVLWRVGEGQIKLWIVVPFFALFAALSSRVMHGWTDMERMVAWHMAGQPLPYTAEGYLGFLGYFIYMPSYFGYGGTLILIFGIMALWYAAVTWNEKTQKFLVPM